VRKCLLALQQRLQPEVSDSASPSAAKLNFFSSQAEVLQQKKKSRQQNVMQLFVSEFCFFSLHAW